MKIIFKLFIALSFLILTISANAESKIMLFGDSDYKKYLGCLNCSKFSSDSIHNEFGQHGSKFSTISINNQFGQYGSQFSQLSPCNAYATNPPAIVDDTGNFYGYLTLNKFLSQATDNQDMLAWLKYKVCSN